MRTQQNSLVLPGNLTELCGQEIPIRIAGNHFVLLVEHVDVSFLARSISDAVTCLTGPLIPQSPEEAFGAPIAKELKDLAIPEIAILELERSADALEAHEGLSEASGGTRAIANCFRKLLQNYREAESVIKLQTKTSVEAQKIVKEATAALVSLKAMLASEVEEKQALRDELNEIKNEIKGKRE